MPEAATGPADPHPPDASAAAAVPAADPWQALAAEVERRTPLPLLVEPPPRRRGVLVWSLALCCALGIGAAGIGLRQPGGRADAGPPPLPAEATELLDARCAEQVAVLLAGVQRYAARGDGPPPTLEALFPDYLPAPPVDPDSGAPFGYQVMGDAVSITCPDGA